MVPARHAAWAELILIQLFVSGVSFLGHLGGILAGLLSLRLRRSYMGPEPVTTVVRNIVRFPSWPLKFVRDLFRYRRRRISGRGTIGGRQAGRNVPDTWRCKACTFDNSGLLSVCKMCGTEREGVGLSSIWLSNRPRDLSLEELHR